LRASTGTQTCSSLICWFKLVTVFQLLKNNNHLSISVGAGKFLGLLRICVRILPNLPVKYPKRGPPKKRKKQKKLCMWFWAPVYFKSKQDGRHICSYTQRVCSDFQGFCEGF